VAINAFVGGVVGIERSTLAPLAGHDFHLASKAAILSFLISFGLVKAASNFVAGRLADRVGRRAVLLAGWLAALPVPLLIISAPSWGWVVFANCLLGVNQGLAWSMTVTMKIDLVGPHRRGFALGLNEASGYLAVSAAAAVAGFLAASHGIRPVPYWLAEGLAVFGLLLSLGTRETAGHVELESAGRVPTRSVGTLMVDVSFRNRTMSSSCQAGMVNNLNDGMAWALLPLFFAAHGLGLREIGLLAGVYPAVWGAGQLGTGWISDHLGRKRLIVAGMLCSRSQSPASWLSLASRGGSQRASSLALAPPSSIRPCSLLSAMRPGHPIARRRSTSIGFGATLAMRSGRSWPGSSLMLRVTQPRSQRSLC
jgi:MFS family permease